MISRGIVISSTVLPVDYTLLTSFLFKSRVLGFLMLARLLGFFMPPTRVLGFLIPSP